MAGFRYNLVYNVAPSITKEKEKGMSTLNHIPAGAKIPEDFNVIIEIPANAGSVKYEFNKEAGLLSVDRFMPTPMHYPCNYGFIPNTLADDGDPVDVLVITPYDIQPGCLIRCRAIGVLKMKDEAGEDSKILALPIEKICLQFSDVQSLNDIPKIILDGIVHFFEHYKDLEPNKWVKVSGWDSIDAAHHEIKESVSRFENQKATV